MANGAGTSHILMGWRVPFPEENSPPEWNKLCLLGLGTMLNWELQIDPVTYKLLTMVQIVQTVSWVIIQKVLRFEQS